MTLGVAASFYHLFSTISISYGLYTRMLKQTRRAKVCRKEAFRQEHPEDVRLPADMSWKSLKLKKNWLRTLLVPDFYFRFISNLVNVIEALVVRH